MITAIKNSFVLLAVILLSLISFVGHASAMKSRCRMKCMA